MKNLLAYELSQDFSFPPHQPYFPENAAMNSESVRSRSIL